MFEDPLEKQLDGLRWHPKLDAEGNFLQRIDIGPERPQLPRYWLSVGLISTHTGGHRDVSETDGLELAIARKICDYFNYRYSGSTEKG